MPNVNSTPTSMSRAIAISILYKWYETYRLTHLDDLGKLYSLLRSILKIIDSEDLEARLVELRRG